MKSEKIVVQAPMSYTGSAKRLWRITDRSVAVRWLVMIPLALLLIAGAWVAVSGWYIVFGLLMAPYRLIRRGSRKRRLDDQRHREVIERGAGG